MTISTSALQELHRLHRQITDLRERLARGPKQIKAGEANLANLQGKLDESKGTLTRARVASDDKQLQLKQREDRIADLKFKLNNAGSNKEFQALKEQIAADQQANSVLSDEILEALDRIDQLEEKVAEAQELLEKATGEVDSLRSRVNNQQQGLEEELGRVTTNLHQAESVLPDDFKVEYDRIAKARGEGALAVVDGEICTGCYTMITSQMINELKLSKPVFCKSCGCLLYLDEE